MHEVNHHPKEKYSWLPPVDMTLARCFFSFAYYDCHIHATNSYVYLLQSTEVCVCVCVCVTWCIRENLGFTVGLLALIIHTGTDLL